MYNMKCILLYYLILIDYVVMDLQKVSTNLNLKEKYKVKRNRQVIILHNLANWVTFVFSLYIQVTGKIIFFDFGSFLEILQSHVTAYVSKNWTLIIFKSGNTDRLSIQVWLFFIKKLAESLTVFRIIWWIIFSRSRDNIKNKL